MSLGKRLLFGMLLTIVVLAGSGGVNVYKAEFDAPKPHTWSRAPMPPAPALPWFDRHPAKKPGRWHKTFRTKGESLALFLPIQFKKPEDLGVGKLLVASRDLGDPSFAKTVVLLVHYDENGVVGLVLNRRTDIPLSRVLDLEAAKDRSDAVYLGGPVGSSAYLPFFSPRPKSTRLRTSSVEFI